VTDLSNPLFGKATTQNLPRSLQFGLHLAFSPPGSWPSHGLALAGLMRWVGFDFRLDWVKAKHRFDVCEQTQTVNVPGG
jgi:hypothetical protein